MREYSLGDTELLSYDLEHLPEDIEWIVYEYSNSSYQGDGMAVCKAGNELIIYNLGHCSCYGPLDLAYVDRITIDTWYSQDVHATPELPKEVIYKVNELLILESAGD